MNHNGIKTISDLRHYLINYRNSSRKAAKESRWLESRLRSAGRAKAYQTAIELLELVETKNTEGEPRP